MTQRLQTPAIFTDAPFTGEGASLYVTDGTRVQYRNMRVLPRRKKTKKSAGRWIKGTTGNHDIAATSVPKSARVGSVNAPTAEISFAIPSAMWPGAGLTKTLVYDVRPFKDDVENETSNFRIGRIVIDENGDPVEAILGTATLLVTEIRAAGIVRLRFEYHASRDGLQPVSFKAIRTAGPSSPADATANYVAGQTLYDIDTPALSDASAYTYKIQAVNGSTTVDLLTGIQFTADATGPIAATAGTATLR